ncbi:MAG: FAD-binding oxidoreductase [Methanomassiliicoccus sp.]|nr:FAD-binding oxidoreductase [Methanomassiliicoccus sp.]
MQGLTIKDADGKDIVIDASSLDDLVRRIRGEVIFANDPGYEEARQVWNAMIDRQPAVIVRCADADDVIACVQMAAKHNLKTSVRGGGHNVAGNAVSDGGLVIDLSRMHEVVVDEERMIASVQGGATLGDVDGGTQRFALATPLGIVPQTGVAGLTLHGGLGWLLRRFGTSADNLVGAEIVTADGVLRHAGEDENSDLLWALRGGGGNFGVVTSLELKLHRVGPRVWAGLVLYSLDDMGEVLLALDRYMSEAPEELTANVLL